MAEAGIIMMNIEHHLAETLTKEGEDALARRVRAATNNRRALKLSRPHHHPEEESPKEESPEESPVERMLKGNFSNILKMLLERGCNADRDDDGNMRLRSDDRNLLHSTPHC